MVRKWGNLGWKKCGVALLPHFPSINSQAPSTLVSPQMTSSAILQWSTPLPRPSRLAANASNSNCPKWPTINSATTINIYCKIVAAIVGAARFHWALHLTKLSYSILCAYDCYLRWESSCQAARNHELRTHCCVHWKDSEHLGTYLNIIMILCTKH